MNYKGITLTGEQEAAVNDVTKGFDTKIKAPAGSGKTFVLGAAANELKGKYGAYIAFNKAIADSASQSFPSNVECRTGHSIAFRSVGHKYQNRLKRITGTLLANTEDIGETEIYPTPAAKGYLILETIRHFCYSDDLKIDESHVPQIVGPYNEQTIEVMESDIALYAGEIWDLMRNVGEGIPITHDVYLKVWAMTNPILKKHFILFDEAQDANPVILGVLKKQVEPQMIYVGDPFQQIYGWRGAINAMEKIETDSQCFITQSFRFGQAIATMANTVLRGYMPKHKHPPLIKGVPGKYSAVMQIDKPDAVISRTNSGVVTQVFKYLEKGEKVYIQGGPNQLISMLKGVQDLQNGNKTYVEDLALFNTWQEVVDHSKTQEGSELKSLVTIVSKHGVAGLMNTLYKTEKTPEPGSIVLTTAHKAKGLEWVNVKLDGDFKTVSPGGQPLAQGEINTLYVAVTRALSTLDITDCPACHPESFNHHLAG